MMCLMTFSRLLTGSGVASPQKQTRVTSLLRIQAIVRRNEVRRKYLKHAIEYIRRSRSGRERRLWRRASADSQDHRRPTTVRSRVEARMHSMMTQQSALGGNL
jgi:hypothetical protein